MNSAIIWAIVAAAAFITVVAMILNAWADRYLWKLKETRREFKEYEILTDMSKECYRNSVQKGFHNKPLELGTSLMLIVSELGEALEADRVNKHADLERFSKRLATEGRDNWEQIFKEEIKDTVEDELADVLIRILDLSGKLGIDIGAHTSLKIQYNKQRPHKNGKEY